MTDLLSDYLRVFKLPRLCEIVQIYKNPDSHGLFVVGVVAPVPWHGFPLPSVCNAFCVATLSYLSGFFHICKEGGRS
jgi:hypothetical protein